MITRLVILLNLNMRQPFHIPQTNVFNRSKVSSLYLKNPFKAFIEIGEIVCSKKNDCVADSLLLTLPKQNKTFER